MSALNSRRRPLAGNKSAIGRKADYDLALIVSAGLGYRLSARIARQGQVTLGVRLGTGTAEPVPVAFAPYPCNGYCLIGQRWPALLPLVISPSRRKPPCRLYG